MAALAGRSALARRPPPAPPETPRSASCSNRLAQKVGQIASSAEQHSPCRRSRPPVGRPKPSSRATPCQALWHDPLQALAERGWHNRRKRCRLPSFRWTRSPRWRPAEALRCNVPPIEPLERWPRCHARTSLFRKEGQRELRRSTPEDLPGRECPTRTPRTKSRSG